MQVSLFRFKIAILLNDIAHSFNFQAQLSFFTGLKKFQTFLQTLYNTIPVVIQRCLDDQTMDKKIVGNTREYLQLLSRSLSKQK